MKPLSVRNIGLYGMSLNAGMKSNERDKKSRENREN